jgi:hypothetical protein
MSMIKAVDVGGEWVLEALAAPFGSPVRKDGHGEYFTPRTRFREDMYGLPPTVFYHGFNADGTPQAEPDYIGKSVARWVDSAGVWYRVVLDKAKAKAKQVWNAALDRRARCSPGTVEHLRRVARDGELLEWPIVELSVFDLGTGRPASPYAVALPVVKALYPHILASGKDRTMDDETDVIKDAIAEAIQAGRETAPKPPTREQIKSMIDAQLVEHQRRAEAEQQAERERQESIAAAVAAREAELRQEFESEMIKARRLPMGGVFMASPHVARFAALRPYDNLDAGDTAFLIGFLQSAQRTGASKYGVSESAFKALAIKLSEDTSRIGAVGQAAMKSLGIKANEVMTSTMTSFGDEWVGQAYSTSLWETIRLETFVVDLFNPIEIPHGMESIDLPLEGSDPVFYAVGQATDIDASGWPAATIPASKTGTGKRTLKPAKLAGRVVWEGDLEEDSVIPFAGNLRKQLGTSAAEYLEHVVIDGDTATAAATNINNGGTGDTPVAKAAYTLFDGVRKLCLVTNTANARDGGVLGDDDYIETVKLMGPGGRNALDKKKVCFIIDPATNWKTLQLPSVKTRDVNTAATVESGDLTMIYGYRVKISGQQARVGGGLTNAAGKVDQVTVANNTKGSIISLRPDQWAMGYKRKLNLETTRIARADAYEVVAIMRVALINRDLESAAISYNLTV